MASRSGNETDVNVDVSVDGDRTTIEVSGQRRAAVVVRSDSGERIYLPPERDEDEGDTGAQSSYEPAGGDSPYQGVKSESPYGATRETPATLGLSKTATGFRIIHPEPVTDVRFLQ